MNSINQIIKAVPRDFNYATTINFWVTVALNLLSRPSGNFKEFLESISFGIMIAGSVICSDNLNNLSEILNYDNSIQHILPFLIYKFNCNKLHHLIPSENKLLRLLLIGLVIKTYTIYLNYVSESNPTKVYTNYGNNLKLMIGTTVLYTLLSKN